MIYKWVQKAALSKNLTKQTQTWFSKASLLVVIDKSKSISSKVWKIQKWKFKSLRIKRLEFLLSIRKTILWATCFEKSYRWMSESIWLDTLRYILSKRRSVYEYNAYKALHKKLSIEDLTQFSKWVQFYKRNLI